MNSIKTMLNLIKALNDADFRAFPQKNDPKRVTLSVAATDGNRYFLTRVAAGLNEDGSPKYMWARGTAMRAISAPAVNNNGQGMSTAPGVVPAAPTV